MGLEFDETLSVSLRHCSANTTVSGAASRQCSLRVIREDGMVWYGVVWYGMVSDSTARTFQRRRKRA